MRPGSRYSHVQEVQERLNFLRYPSTLLPLYVLDKLWVSAKRGRKMTNNGHTGNTYFTFRRFDYFSLYDGKMHLNMCVVLSKIESVRGGLGNMAERQISQYNLIILMT